MKSLISQLHGLEINPVEDLIIAILLKTISHEKYGNIITMYKLLPNPIKTSIEVALLKEEKKINKLGTKMNMKSIYYTKWGSTLKGLRLKGALQFVQEAQTLQERPLHQKEDFSK